MPAPSLFRDRAAPHSGRVSFVELFFDLVFVFAITQLSHLLLSHYTLLGAFETLLMLLAVWWVWIYTSWVTNWMNPETGPVRLMMFALMALGLGLTTSLSQAFSSQWHGLIFAGCYVAMQLGRSIFTALCLRGHNRDNHLNFVRISIWLAASGVFWIWGGLADGHTRLILWCLALGIDYISPRAFFWVPGLGRSQFATWDIDGEHFAERCGLFVIIALGESILVMGDSFMHQPQSTDVLIAFGQSFLTCLAMWWLYFGINAEKASHQIARSALPGRLAQIAYTYVHILIVAGIILTAVGDEHMLMHPHTQASWPIILSILGGPALYLLGNLLFIRVTSGIWPPMHLLGLGVLSACGVLSPSLMTPLGHVTALGLGVTSTLVLLAVSLLEPWLYARKAEKGHGHA
ncbi:MAG: low temperature requirement protein A [Asticcacaulis sp.]